MEPDRAGSTATEHTRGYEGTDDASPALGWVDGASSAKVCYRSLDCDSYYAGCDFKLFVSPLNGSRQVLPAISEVLLTACDRFRTLDEHARTICRADPFRGVSTDTIRELLAGLASAGLLVRHESSLHAAGDSSVATVPSPSRSSGSQPAIVRPGCSGWWLAALRTPPSRDDASSSSWRTTPVRNWFGSGIWRCWAT